MVSAPSDEKDTNMVLIVLLVTAASLLAGLFLTVGLVQFGRKHQLQVEYALSI